jgi:hypothetical protein
MITSNEIVLPADAELPLADAADLSAALADIGTPLHPAPPKGKREHRKTTRYYVRWHVAVHINDQGLHHGFVRDLSVKGAAILVGKNLNVSESIKLHILVPPLDAHSTPRIIEVTGEITYSVHDPDELQFRVGISFDRFSTEHDPAFLEEHLNERAFQATL